MKKISFALLLCASFGTLAIISKTAENKHFCTWEDCAHNGKIMTQENFVPTWGSEEGSDSYYCELVHFLNPEMTYEETENYIFSGVE